jgi:Relaxase/Mobilisation nuclease domain
VIIKGKSRAQPSALAAHLGNAETNERVNLLETRGAIAKDLRGALVEMDAYAAGSRCERSLYHAAISPEPPHRLTPEQRMEAIEMLEQKMGLDGHTRAIVLHEKHGREHLHVVWSRIDLQKMRAVSDSHNYRKHEEVARDLERRFGHERVQGAHAEREGVARPQRTPSRAELRQEERTGIKDKDVRAEVTEAFRASDGPEAFKAALEDRGYKLAKGDRRDFVVIDKAGGIHSLARRIEDVRAAELRAHMAAMDREKLPTADQAVAQQLAEYGPPPKPEPTPRRDLTEEELRQRRETRRDHRENKLEAAYGRSEGYVAQSRAALREAKRRQIELDRARGNDGTWERIEAGEAERAKRQREDSSSGKSDDTAPSKASSAADTPPEIELTDGQRERLERLAEHKAELDRYGGRENTSPQRGAPGGGRTRSR